MKTALKNRKIMPTSLRASEYAHNAPAIASEYTHNALASESAMCAYERGSVARVCACESPVSVCAVASDERAPHGREHVGMRRAYARSMRAKRHAKSQGENGYSGERVLGYGKTDRTLVFVALLLSVLGIVFIYSASSYSAQKQFGDAFHYVKTQSVALALGVFCAFVLWMTDMKTIKKFSPILYVVGLVLLSLVFVPVIGVESYGAKRWLNLGFFTIQPSEYAKFFTVLAIAAFSSKKDMRKFSNVLAVLLIGSLTCVLLILEPNMSITVCMAGAVFLMLFAVGAKTSHLVCLILPAIAGAVVLVLVEPYRFQRLLAFLDPWKSPLEEGYQLIQSYYALGSGGLFGVGLFKSRQKYLFLPFAESDFILSVVGEETGLFGIAAVMILFAVFVWRGLIIARNARDRFSCYAALGITAVTGLQSLVNMAVVCGAVPPTGLPLPFMSAGGSSLVAYLGAVGVLANISKNSAPYLRVDSFYER